MNYTMFTLNRGINRPLEFWGLKAQYVTILAAGLVGLLLTFALLFIAGIKTYVCFALVLPAAGALFKFTRRLSNRYGQHGLMKKLAANRLPWLICSTTRRAFFNDPENQSKQNA